VSALEQDAGSPPAERGEWVASELRRIVVRLSDGDVVQAGTAPSLESAKTFARGLIAELEQPDAEWPRIGDRLLRPEAITSVDVLRIAS
jgi:hypothetical protein